MEAAELPGPTQGLRTAVTALLQTDPSVLDGPALQDLVIDLVKVRSLLDAATARFVPAWVGSGIWAIGGSKTPAARLASETRCSAATAKAVVRRGTRLSCMAVTREAFEAGQITTDHVDALARAGQDHRKELFARDESVLVDDARRMAHFDQFSRVVRYWKDAADDASKDGDSEARARALREQRHLDVSPMLEGALDVRGQLEGLDGEIFRVELARRERELFEADWAACRAEWGPNASSDKLCRTPAQRRCDAIVIMARRSSAAGGQKPNRPLFSIVIDFGTLAGPIRESFNGTVFTPGQIAQFLSEADIERVVFDGRSRVLDVGVTDRLFSGATRRAVEVRDRCCTYPGCNVEAELCHVDHIIEHCDGGPTVQDNGRLLCPAHNRQRPGRQTSPPDASAPSEPGPSPGSGWGDRGWDPGESEPT